MSEFEGKIKVTVSDPDTGEVFEEKTVANDYVLICAGDRYLKSWQVWGATHQLNIGSRRRDAAKS